MPATVPTHAEGGPIREDPGRPHVPTASQSERTYTIMHDAPDIRIPAQRRPGHEHQPWCVNHIPGADANDTGTCMSADMVLPGQIVALTWQVGEPVQVNLCTGDRIEVVTVAEVKQRATAMLAQVAVAEAYAAVPA